MISALLALSIALPQAPARGGEIESVVATVNGEAILESEVLDALDSVSPLFDRTKVVQQLVYQRLLDQKARAAGISIDDEKLTSVMRERVAQAGGWEEYKAKLAEKDRTPEQDRQEIRRALLADRYVDECTGLVVGSEHVRPDLARMLQVTPKEVQDVFRDHKDEFRTVDRRVFGRVQLGKGKSEADETSAREKLLRLRAAAIEQHHGSLKDAAAALFPDEKDLYVEQEITQSERSGLRPEILQFLAATPTAVPSPVLETSRAFLCVVKVEERLGRQREFADVQEGIERALLSARRDQARWVLGAELLKGAEIWPKDLIPPAKNAENPAPEVAPPSVADPHRGS